MGSRKNRAMLEHAAVLVLCLAASCRCEEAASPAPPCSAHESIVLPQEAVKLDDAGTLSHGELAYPASSYWTDDSGRTRGCICRVASKPCLRKCCGPGEIIAPADVFDRDKRCVPAGPLGPGPAELVPAEDRLSPGMRSAIDERPDLRHWFEVFEGLECDGEDRFILFLNPSEFAQDVHQLHTNGTLWVQEHSFLPVGSFCMDRQAGDPSGALVTLMCWTSEPDKPQGHIVHRIGAFLSLPFLAVTFVVYAIIPELRNIYGKTLMCYVFALLLAYTSLSLSYFSVLGFECAIIAYIVHFSFLASFFWLNVMCFDIWWTFGGFRSLHGSVKQRERKKFIMYSIYAWGSASVLTLTCMVMDLVPGIPESFIRPEFGKESCWFYTQEARLLYFYAPMGVTVVCNIFLFILTSLKILKHKKDTARQLKGSDSRRHDDNKQWFNLYLKLFIVMGINWSTEIISWVLQDKWDGKWNWLWYITDLANTLQGVIIFIIFVWKDKIKRLLLRRFGREGGSFLSRNSTRNGCATTHSTATSCVTTTAPLQEKTNPYSWKDPKGKTNVTFDESDEV